MIDTELEKLREKILALDKEIIVLLAKRLQYAEEIGKIKKQKNLPYEDSVYFQFSLKIKQDFGQNFGLTSDEIKLFFHLLQDLSINRMKKDVSL